MKAQKHIYRAVAIVVALNCFQACGLTENNLIKSQYSNFDRPKNGVGLIHNIKKAYDGHIFKNKSALLDNSILSVVGGGKITWDIYRDDIGNVIAGYGHIEGLNGLYNNIVKDNEGIGIVFDDGRIVCDNKKFKSNFHAVIGIKGEIDSNLNMSNIEKVFGNKWDKVEFPYMNYNIQHPQPMNVILKYLGWQNYQMVKIGNSYSIEFEVRTNRDGSIKSISLRECSN